MVQTRVMLDVGETSGERVVPDHDAIQRRTVRVLLSSQAAGGVGLVATYIVTALLAKDITGSTVLATIAAACLSIGAAAVSYPLARVMRSRGRRVGLRLGYLIGASGAVIALVGATTRSYPLLCLGVLGAGAGNAANLATRYAASDLAREHRRARTISLIVWATAIGSTTGSVVSGFASDVGETLGLPSKGGSYLLSGLMFLLAAAIVELLLRPDPLAVAGGLGARDDTATKKPGRESLALIWANPAARLAVAAMVVSQVTMVGVMSLTPLHMDEGGQSQAVIGLMMAFHIWGMYLFSPVVGALTDRFGQYPMLVASGALCTLGAGWAAVTPTDGRLGVFMGNFLIGLGWSFGVVAASSLIVAQFPIEQRVGVQGVGDLAMIGSGALAGVSSGALYALFGYGGVNTGNAVFGALLIVATATTYLAVRRQRPPVTLATR
jgi:MFS family permease